MEARLFCNLKIFAVRIFKRLFAEFVTAVFSFKINLNYENVDQLRSMVISERLQITNQRMLVKRFALA